MSLSPAETPPITLSKIAGYMPDNFPARLFTGGQPFRAMNTVYTLMDRFAPAYTGGVWSAFEGSNGALFMAADSGVMAPPVPK